MRILVFSDSHGRNAAMTTICKTNPPDAIIHLGDCVRDCQGLELYAPLISLRGNNDYTAAVPLETLLDWEGVRLLACHGHSYSVKNGLGCLAEAARTKNAQVALFGHTHIPCSRQEKGILLCNPGSIGLPYNGRPCYGELMLADGQAVWKIEHPSR